MSGTLFLIKLYIYTNCLWWNRGGGTVDIDVKLMELFGILSQTWFLRYMEDILPGNQKLLVFWNILTLYCFECFSSDS